MHGDLKIRSTKKPYERDFPVISIITVVFNGAPVIRRTIESIINQTYPNIEFIVIDGGSTDGTIGVLREYADHIDFCLSERDNGIYDAMNKGIDLATGSWVNFMNAGDRFASPDILKRLCEKGFEQADIVFGDAIIEYETFETPFIKHPLSKIWKHSPFCHQASFAKATLLKSYRFDTDYRIGADHDFFYRAYKDGKRFSYFHDVVCYFDGRQGTTKKRIVEAIKDKKKAALRYEYSLAKEIYFNLLLLYIRLVVISKTVLGPGITRKLVRYVRDRSHS